MTTETKRAIDTKIAQLGNMGCIKFIRWMYPDVSAFSLEKAAHQPDGIKRRIRAILRGENWGDLTQLFLDYNPNTI